jgi:hypothetical protein
MKIDRWLVLAGKAFEVPNHKIEPGARMRDTTTTERRRQWVREDKVN